MFLGRQMLHQQVGLALSQFPKGLAAELASDQAPPTRLAFAARMDHAPRTGRSCEVGINLDSLNCRRDRQNRLPLHGRFPRRSQTKVSAMS